MAEAHQLKKWRLEKEQELRFEVPFKSEITVVLKRGSGEVFGTELAAERPYKFSGSKAAIFSWHGAHVEISGPCHAYLASETPMVMYANAHAILESKRDAALAASRASPSPGEFKQGPRVLIAGPMDTGKSTLAKILLGYAARAGREPIYIDLDIGQQSISIPSTIGVVPVDRPASIEEGFMAAPLVFFFGDVSLDKNADLYRRQLKLVNEKISPRVMLSPELAASGMVINTCGWITDLGYDLLLAAIQSLKVDVVLVVDNERLYSDLVQAHKDIEVVKMQKSGGVVTRPREFRRETRDKRIREYFYGPREDLCPHQVVVPFSKLDIFKVGSSSKVKDYALPLGEAQADPFKLVRVTPSPSLVHSILSVSHAHTEEEALDANIAGFLYVTDVNSERSTITVLSPSPAPPPSTIMLLGGMKWLE
eukprot:TRINITY_DN5253_c0_g1_i1.p1 TRINITY_DN5253_c0_g1~~TRINITY_DN5253_c0_g1_i1.p1  ORF type:complete len:423 (-),score=133.46 TRINITY_DN5253_c0_g1_i1:9-1277(-)